MKNKGYGRYANFFFGWGWGGQVRCIMGDLQVAFEKSRRSISMSPLGLIVHITVLRCTDFKQFL